MEDNKVILFFTVFVMFLAFVATMSDFYIIGSSVPDEPEDSPVADCNVDGWDALIDAAGCLWDNIGFITQFVGISGESKWANYLIFIPFSVLLGYVVFKQLNPLG